MESVAEIKKKTEEVLKTMSDYKYFLDKKAEDIYKDYSDLGEVNSKVESAKKELDAVTKKIDELNRLKDNESKAHFSWKDKEEKEVRLMKDQAKNDREEAKNILDGANELKRILASEKESLSKEKKAFEVKCAKLIEIAG